ncbi:oxidoreductase [Lojkania enalia]|uniref:Oxidoreductase n=1 Tax=Lojkania enalia TaxID=147567 RepID=A0A9P4MWU3_9PLEO|nr:oxidoreductase [Didymosphaeria enalia]
MKGLPFVISTAVLATSLVHASSLGTCHPANRSPPTLTWSLLNTANTNQFRGLAPVSHKVAWVSGTNSTVLRTTDGGNTWKSVGPQLTGPDAELEFRDIQAWSAKKAVILSIGFGPESRIYFTEDGGKNWTQSFGNEEEAAFYDCIAFENEKRGLAMSDPVDGKIRLIETLDGGKSWSVIDSAGIPPARANEWGFAASGTCLTTTAGRWYVGTGGEDPGRVFYSSDGHIWDVSNTTLLGAEAAGVFSVRFRDRKHGIAVGGDFENPTGNMNNAAWSTDGGRTWQSAARFPDGYRSGSSWVPGHCDMALAVGSTGSDFTLDGGRTWIGFDNGTFDSVECLEGGLCWASGAGGRVARLYVK